MKSKKGKKWIKGILLLLLIVQLPFGYEILESYWLRSYLQNLSADTKIPETPFRDVKGVIHIHSADGGHSLGTYPEIIKAGKETGNEWIFLTEHPREPKLFKQIKDPEIVLIYGWEEELEQGGRLLRDDRKKFQIFSEFEKEQVPDFCEGIEIFNLAESASSHNNLSQWISWIYHRLTIPELFFFQIWEIDRQKIEIWDQLLGIRPITATAGNDAHQNLGLILQTATGDEIFRIQVDPYQTSMQTVSNHLLVPEEQTLSEDVVLEALKKGSSYICFDLLADPRGFSFHARSGEKKFPPGSVVPTGSELRLQSPFPVHFNLYWSGEIFKELEGTDFTVPVAMEGSYRAEVHLIDPPHMLEGKPWIITNSIYVGGTP